MHQHSPLYINACLYDPSLRQTSPCLRRLQLPSIGNYGVMHWMSCMNRHGNVQVSPLMPRFASFFVFDMQYKELCNSLLQLSWLLNKLCSVCSLHEMWCRFLIREYAYQLGNGRPGHCGCNYDLSAIPLLQ